MLVIWPNRNNFEVAYRGTGLKYACTRLESDAASSLEPTEESLEFVNYVLSRAKEAPTSVIPSVCRAAIAWKDEILWNDTLKKLFWSKDRPLLENSDLSNALRTFGFEPIMEVYVFSLPPPRCLFTLLTFPSASNTP